MDGYIYPRLSRAVAKLRIEEIRIVATDVPEKLSNLVAYGDPRATLPATGGRSATEDRVADIRQTVMAALNPWAGRVVGASSSEFDRVLGASLHSALDISPAEAANEDMWSFLTLLVFPDVAYQRFPNLHENRLLGLPRNVLRRVWFRHSVLGDILFRGPKPLQEDELVGLMERSSMARNPRLLRSLACQILEYTGNDRTAYARQLIKEATITTGPFMLDILDQSALTAHLEDCARRVRTE